MRDSADTLAILSCEGHHYHEFIHEGRSQFLFVIYMFFAYLMYFWEPFVSFCDVRRVSKPTIAFVIILGWILGGILDTPGILGSILGTTGTPQNPIRCQVPHIYMVF